MTKGKKVLIEATVDKIEGDGTIKVTMPYHSNGCKSEQVVVGIPISSIYPNNELIKWAVDRWNDEVKNRPMANIHRRTLDDTWRQIIRKAGGDDIALIGPTHDQLKSVSVPAGDSMSTWAESVGYNPKDL